MRIRAVKKLAGCALSVAALAAVPAVPIVLITVAHAPVLPVVCIAVLVICPFGLYASTRPGAAEARADARARRAAKAARYCTKHQVVRYVPGGPDHLVWVLGPHRTPGNACDGPEHQRAPAWW